mgnify:FL=1
MSKTAVVFWSGTGNTEEMANAVLEGMKENGADASIYSADAFRAGDVDAYDAIAFGCPAMGAEVLEEDEFQPLFDECKPALEGKKVALFGSYGWGDVEWLRNWEDDCKDAGIELACDSVVCNDAPDEDAITACKELGAALV